MSDATIGEIAAAFIAWGITCYGFGWWWRGRDEMRRRLENRFHHRSDGHVFVRLETDRLK